MARGEKVGLAMLMETTSNHAKHMAVSDQLMVKDKGMGSAKFTHLRLMNSTVCILCFRKNHFEVHLMFHQEKQTPKSS